MRTCSLTPCQSRHLERRALVWGQLQPCTLPARSASHGRRINILQCLSASSDTSGLAQLADRDASFSTSGLDHALSRRTLLLVSTLALTAPYHLAGRPAHAEEAAAASAPAAAAADGAPAVELTPYSNAKQRYTLMVPASWDAKGKAGADVLFEDPSRRSTSVGVTVNPVKVPTIRQFGGLQEVGDKLLEAERRKESTLAVVLVGSSERVGASGATLYEYEYELDSTRGRKRILNTVTIFGSRLYILNAAFKCDKEGCGEEARSGVQLLRDVAATFDVTAD
ncbi:hypothetical protein PLESTB_000046000 [Pleodorina starrii]|uniref:PsbP C-terminal domain-containing protein n=1 Tax=Pleodorina starrii TaxID=330485 RepID=A0A9W6B942_9CHLO|nr:hypothetical protein PLESTM_001086700 [Pleodorina starrii]GLC47979.1 hypothetical protein PLESTB_000046000 [Pleodorina starrii]GLC70586.1 hypothetical protein PLESTF_001011400 [Pleodorina starrii]